MYKKLIALTVGSAVIALALAACSSPPTPTSIPAATKAPNTPTTAPATSATTNSAKAPAAASAFETRSNSGGSVTVDVKPVALEPGKPIAFDVAMNTHSVELDDDMTQISILRDDSGKEYKPTAWEGDEGGGHHRSGALKFAALGGKPKYVELVIKGLAKVPERVFKWELP